MSKKPIKMDRINRNILKELQGNARISNNELAERIGLSPSACLQRVKALEESAYILQYVMAVDINKLCINVKAYLHITLKNQGYQDFSVFEKGVKKYPEFCDCLRVNGEINYIAFVVCSTIADFNELCDNLLQSPLGIGKITSYFVLDEPMWFSGYPLDGLEWRNPE
ncbi:Lrp/AsnC family transcriptional regulator [Dasania marina]|uniref:Lrp/AsnC family transcriptional regulator n=1 Tax=Dasania marina TaxID=471499 RepID=UPI0004AF9806|nr:Lrp/AsnC family transcriptional regulator [Dasania marina]|tara:strand:+ start:31309 stop:31809 length:501 start_codon:yes stop_codon:yes gene_type:complete